MFVPRRRSEFLVDTEVSLARGPDPVIVDLCCGTGALGLAVAVALGGAAGGAELHAADIDPAAVACARRNVEPPAATSTRATFSARCRGRCAAASAS